MKLCLSLASLELYEVELTEFHCMLFNSLKRADALEICQVGYQFEYQHLSFHSDYSSVIVGKQREK